MNLRQVRKKIKTIGNVRKITKAMEMVAAVKMKKAQRMAIEGKPYQEILIKVINQIINPSLIEYSPFFQSKKTAAERDLYLFISSNKGLCGAFNANLFRLALREIDFSQSDFIVLGKKASTIIAKMGGIILADFSNRIPFVDNVSSIFSLIEERFLSGENSAVFLFYNRFISSFRSEPVKERILPLVEWKKDPLQIRLNYLFEPSPKEILTQLIKDYLQYRIRMAILDSEAAEQSARMMAMKNASDNADEIVYSLTLLRNKLRQQSITYELLDMVTAKEAAG